MQVKPAGFCMTVHDRRSLLFCKRRLWGRSLDFGLLIWVYLCVSFGKPICNEIYNSSWIFFVWLVIPDPYFWNTGLQQTTRSPNIAEMTQRSLRMVRKKNWLERYLYAWSGFRKHVTPERRSKIGRDENEWLGCHLFNQDFEVFPSCTFWSTDGLWGWSHQTLWNTLEIILLAASNQGARISSTMACITDTFP